MFSTRTVVFVQLTIVMIQKFGLEDILKIDYTFARFNVSSKSERLRCNLSVYSVTIRLFSECDSCYKLVEAEVNLLREMQTNLSSYVAQLEAQDNNTILGPFHQRLDATQEKMQTLIEFVSDISSHSIQTLQKKVRNSKIIGSADNGF